MAGLTTQSPISSQLETLQGLFEEWCGCACLRNGILGFSDPFHCLHLDFTPCSAVWNACLVLVPQVGDILLGCSG